MADDDQDRLDLGALRAAPAHYRRLVKATAARAVRPSLWAQLARAAWPLVAGAALVAAAALALPAPASAPAGAALTAEAFSDWANQGAIPGTADLLSVAEGAER